MLSLTVAATMIKGDANPRSFQQPPRPSVVRTNPLDEIVEGYRPDRSQKPQELEPLPPGDPTLVFARLFDPTRRTIRTLFVLGDASSRRLPGPEAGPVLPPSAIEQRRAQDQERFAKLNDDAKTAAERVRERDLRARVLPGYSAERIVIARLSAARDSGPTFSADRWTARGIGADSLSNRLSQLRRGQVPGMMDTDEMIGRDEILRPGLEGTSRLRSESEALRAGNLERFAAGAYGSSRSYQSELRRFDYDYNSGFQRRSMGYTSPGGIGRAGAGPSPSMGYRRLGSSEPGLGR